MNRRDFVLKGSAAMAAILSSRFSAWALTEPLDKQPIFVFVFLRGGCDALNLISPIDDPYYKAARGRGTRIEQGLRINHSLADLDLHLHPEAEGLHRLYQSKDLAIIHACGLQHGTRSHFEAMDLLERGVSEEQMKADGWLTRYLNELQPQGALPASAIGNELPDSFIGSTYANSMSALKDYRLYSGPRAQQLLRDWYEKPGSNPYLAEYAQQALSSLETIQKRLPKGEKYEPRKGVDYKRGDQWGERMEDLAQLIKMDVGLTTATVDFGGWDTHDRQEQRFNRLVQQMDGALSAFYEDLRDYQDRLNIVVMSEFGRRLKANRNGGTDHGYGGMAMVLGGKIKGGKVYGQWPGLQTDALNQGADLNITTDYRQILGEWVQQQLGATAVNKVFPKFSLQGKLGIWG